MILSLLATTTALGAIATKWRSTRKKRTKTLAINPKKEKFQEDQVHHYIEQKIDVLLGDERKQQLQELNAETSFEITENIRKDNRRLIGTGLNASASLILGIVAPQLLVVTVPIAIYLSRQHFQNAWHSVKVNRQINVNVVDSVAAVTAVITGYWRAMAVSMFLFAILSKLRSKAKQRSEKRLTGMFNQVPETVWVLRDGIETAMQLEHLQNGDVLVVRSGEVIPIDAVIANGTGMIDQRLLTGESQPAEKQVGDDVFACTVLLSGELKLLVQNPGQLTVAARIGEILEKTANHKDSHELIAEQVADRAATPTLVMSALALPLAGPSGAIGVLWSCFGHSMLISSPISIMNFLSYASENQILIKDGMAMEKLATVDTVVFDKTGTLTEEEPEVYQIHVFAEYEDNDLLRFAAAAEHRQSHPIAQSIIAAAKKRELLIPDSEDTQCKLGYGIEATIEGLEIHLGSSRFIEDSGIPLHSQGLLTRDQTEANGHSLVMLAINKQLVGAIELKPQLRPAAAEVIQFLKAASIHTCVISGDRELPTRSLSQALGIDQYFADTLPEQKASLIQQLQESGKKVCFIGDGLNDAIALKQADVSISLQGATTAATDTAQIILMDADLSHLTTLIKMGRAFKKNQAQNLRLSVIPAAVSVVGIFALHAGLALAAAMYYTSMVLGIRNANKTIQLDGASEPKRLPPTRRLLPKQSVSKKYPQSPLK